ncbi:hypothetical protein HW561_05930 [Rhodobacteraceae bacterium B1Z28]|uniref:Flavodoxin n=1 Tax=Ruegeria haliotis TaxID=2747601 RepID=A0ABX2PPI6_9RHOB|nr:hypothetical protein [Ruegeria haliotis]NVO55326.1 hypothetical protein [Ruegeria haliotis]
MPISTIAIAYCSGTAATAVCTLEAAGFDVFCPGFHTLNTLPHYALAFGGIPIGVPNKQAADACDLLHSFSGDQTHSASTVSSALNGLGWLTFGVSSPWLDLVIREDALSAA